MRSSDIGHRSFRPRLECLEARDCPTFSIFYHSSVLEIVGHPSLPFGGPGDGLQLTLSGGLLHVSEVGNNGATVVNHGAYRPVANLDVLLNYTNRDITIDLGGGRLVSNVFINLGKGDFAPTSPPLTSNPVNIINGTIGGKLTILGGAGAEFINLGRSGGDPSGPAPLMVQGDTTLALNARPTLFGNTLDINDGSGLFGRLTTSGVENVNVGEIGFPSAFIRKSLSMSVAQARGDVGVLNIYGEIDGNVAFTGTPALQTPIADTIFEASTGLVTGNVTATLGPGGGQFTILGTVDGNASVSSAAGADFITISGTILGSAQLNLSDADNTVRFGGFVGGNLILTAENGDNDLGVTVGNIGGTVNGNLTITLGNGDNLSAQVTTILGGLFTWTSGNGSDDLSLGALVYNVNITFGTGTDSLTLQPGTLLAGTIRGEGGSNTFNQNDALLLPVLHFIDFP